MDFIERIFHISPDGGTGATEAMYVVVVSVIVLLIALRRPIARVIRRPS